jgi:hypothetical protein
MTGHESVKYVQGSTFSYWSTEWLSQAYDDSAVVHRIADDIINPTRISELVVKGITEMAL